MAPVVFEPVAGLHLSSLELDQSTASEIIQTASAKLNKRETSLIEFLKSSNIISARDVATTTKPPDTGGAIDPHSINMKGLQALFAIIGVSFALGAIWFFFWAKNGGFQWRKGDWEDYKSTVLRRKGPNGTTLSNATKSTKLGNGSVVGAGYSDHDTGSFISGSRDDTVTDLSSEAPIIKEKAKAKANKKAPKETAKDRKIREAKQAGWEGEYDNDVRAYRHEKVARVGGINKDSDALHYGTDYAETEGSVSITQSDLRRQSRTNRQSRQLSPEKRQSRRDFSYGNDAAFSSVSESPDHQRGAPAPPPHRPGRYHSPSKQPPTGERTIPGAFNNETYGQGTKAYHHPLPNLGGTGQAKGFRRDRRDSLDE